ncbi:MAG: ABC transporter permease [Campylobacterota bacterium]|nr:ABC transporter permease [Campylobacterota bacterium]
MRIIKKPFEYIGAETLAFISAVHEALHFSWLCIKHFFMPTSYHPAMQSILLKQIYFTVIQILPSFLFIGFIFGSLIIGYVISLAMHYELSNQIGPIITGFVFNEFAPLFTAFLIALRSGAAVNTEVAVMQVSGELNTLKEFNIGLIDYLFLPRIISGMISTLTLSVLFAMIMLTGGYFFSLIYMNMHLHTYLHTLFLSIELSHLLYLIGKSLAFGFVIMLIPIYSGLSTIKAFNAIPVAVLKGMVRLFVAIFIIEVLSLWFRLI